MCANICDIVCKPHEHKQMLITVHDILRHNMINANTTHKPLYCNKEGNPSTSTTPEVSLHWSWLDVLSLDIWERCDVLFTHYCLRAQLYCSLAYLFHGNHVMTDCFIHMAAFGRKGFNMVYFYMHALSSHIYCVPRWLYVPVFRCDLSLAA